jgi:hypothetical protein
MNLSEKFLLACLAASVAALGLASILKQDWTLAIVGVILGLGWWLAEPRSRVKGNSASPRPRVGWLPSVGLSGFTLAAAAGILMDYSAMLMLITATMALAAWDLERFTRRLNLVEPNPASQALHFPHLRRLFTICLVGILLGTLALNIQIRLSFLVTAVLVLLLAFTLARLVRLFRD